MNIIKAARAYNAFLNDNLIIKLKRNSNYITSRCILTDYGTNGGYRYYVLPLKIKGKYTHSEENWDLPQSEVLRISRYRKELEKYSKSIGTIGPDEVKSFMSKPLNFLPPWIVYPLYDVNDWHLCSSGEDQQYRALFVYFMEELSKFDNLFDKYIEAYPIPAHIDFMFDSFYKKTTFLN